MSISEVKSFVEIAGGGGRISNLSIQMDPASTLGALDVATVVTLLNVSSFDVVISSTEPDWLHCLFRGLKDRVVTIEISAASFVGAEEDI